jgi:hypothetical protein
MTYLSILIALFLSSVSQETPRVLFKDFRTYNLEKKSASEALKKLNGKKIRVVGFMMPFDSIENIERFMFMQAPFMGCFHLPPPQAHETLMVESAGLKLAFDQFPQELEGVLTIKETVVEGYLISVYTIQATGMKRADMNIIEDTGLPPGAHFGSDF